MPKNNEDASQHIDLSDLTGALQEALQVNKVSVKAPQWMATNVDVWLTIMEAQFAIANIKVDSTKYFHVIAALPPEVVCKVSDLVTSNPKEGDFEKLKAGLISRCAESKTKRLHAVLDTEEIGDKTPSEFYHHLRHLVNDLDVSDSVLFDRWLQKLPDTIKSPITALQHTLKEMDKILPVADSMYEIAKSSNAISAISSRPRNNRQRDPSSRRGRDEPRRHSHQRQRSRGRFNENGAYCFYHFTFGDSARNCRDGCRYPRRNQQQRNRRPDLASGNASRDRQ